MNMEIVSGSFSYRHGEPILTDVSLSAETGQVVAILGPNGVGKTTLVKCLLGFLRWDSGFTRLDGADIRTIRGRALWRRVAYVPQARTPVFSYSVEEMVLLGRSPYLGDFSVPGAADREAARNAMELAGVTRLAGKRCDRLSGGELQLVLIARALAAEPELLILDEPESGLDFRNQIIVLDLIERLCREKGLTAILNTHYPDHALRISNRALLLFGNGIHLFGRTRSILTEEHMRSAFGVEVAIRRENVGGREYASVIPLGLTEKGEHAPWTNP